MSRFLHSLVRSEEKSCTKKIKFPREESAQKAAADMMRKKKERLGTDEKFGAYKCSYCDGWHIGHETNFDWIPPAHTSYTLLIIKYECDCGPFFTNTVISNRILLPFPSIESAAEVGVVCPECRREVRNETGRRFIPLVNINPDDVVPIETLYNGSPMCEKDATSILTTDR